MNLWLRDFSRDFQMIFNKRQAFIEILMDQPEHIFSRRYEMLTTIVSGICMPPFTIRQKLFSLFRCRFEQGN